MRAFYLALAVIAFVGCNLIAGIFVAEHGLDFAEFADQAYGAPMATFGWFELSVICAVFFAFIWSEGRRVGIGGLWIYVLATLLVGVSFAIPLFLYVREGKLTESA